MEILKLKDLYPHPLTARQKLALMGELLGDTELQSLLSAQASATELEHISKIFKSVEEGNDLSALEAWANQVMDENDSLFRRLAQ